MTFVDGGRIAKDNFATPPESEDDYFDLVMCNAWKTPEGLHAAHMKCTMPAFFLHFINNKNPTNKTSLITAIQFNSDSYKLLKITATILLVDFSEWKQH